MAKELWDSCCTSDESLGNLKFLEDADVFNSTGIVVLPRKLQLL